MNVRFLSPARAELREAVEFLDKQRDGLGQEFLTEVREAIGRIQKHPEAWTPLSEKTRRCRTHRFKYGVIYEATSDEIVIVAIAHMHRKPSYWGERNK